jgi:hypothetical protein
MPQQRTRRQPQRPVRVVPKPNGFWPIDAKLLIQIGGLHDLRGDHPRLGQVDEPAPRVPSMSEERCQRSSEELLDDKPKRCCACGKVMTRVELQAHPDLCEKCSRDVDDAYEAKRDEQDLPWNWFE